MPVSRNGGAMGSLPVTATDRIRLPSTTGPPAADRAGRRCLGRRSSDAS
jgi:hypothetical protein